MLAAIGLLVTEEPIEYHPLFEAYEKDIGPAIRHLDEVDAVSPFFLTGTDVTFFQTFVTCPTVAPDSKVSFSYFSFCCYRSYNPYWKPRVEPRSSWLCVSLHTALLSLALRQVP